MTINLRIKANVDNLTLAEIYELLAKYSRETKNKDNFYEFKGYIFKRVFFWFVAFPTTYGAMRSSGFLKLKIELCRKVYLKTKS